MLEIQVKNEGKKVEVEGKFKILRRVFGLLHLLLRAMLSKVWRLVKLYSLPASS